MTLKDKNIVVTGGSRGLGLGLVEALVAHGARATVVARDAVALAAVHARLGVTTIAADVTEKAAAQRILGQTRPDILVLNAGAKPPMGRFDQVSWADFTAVWETDVKAGLYWLQAALNLPLKPGSRVLVGSSGAAVNGSPMSGGYGGAKRMLWFMAKYAGGVSAQKNSDPLPGDRAAANHRRHRGRRRRRHRLCGSHGYKARSVFGRLRRADAAPRVRREGGIRAGRPQIC
jgi:NAD(P)-dependent dehydrogenase (short-subunit alcohol dehydrogenase family)